MKPILEVLFLNGTLPTIYAEVNIQLLELLQDAGQKLLGRHRLQYRQGVTNAVDIQHVYYASERSSR